MFKTPSIQISQTMRYHNAALNYYLGLTGSPYLHYGYWDPLPHPTEELTLEKFRIAQEAYAAKLLDFIPEGVHTVLDVGCGIGGNAAYLLKKGFEIEGLAPDPLQQERFIKFTQGQVKFHLTQFEDFQADRTYDLILLSESSQYMAAVDIAQGAARSVKPNGYLLLADMMRSDPKYSEGMFSNCHVVEDLHTALLNAGFSLVKAEDISKQIAPTIDLGIDSFRRFGLSTVSYISDVLAIAVPPVHWVLSWVAKRWIQASVVEGLNARILFEQHLCYQIQLWQRSA